MPRRRVLHETVGLRLAEGDQRYTARRRLVVEALADAGRPLTVPELVAGAPELPQSSAYRIVAGLVDAGVVRRVAGNDDHGRFELAEDLAGHHHHFICTRCGTVEDLESTDRLEAALDEAAKVVADQGGFRIDEHRFDLFGRCPRCGG